MLKNMMVVSLGCVLSIFGPKSLTFVEKVEIFA